MERIPVETLLGTRAASWTRRTPLFLIGGAVAIIVVAWQAAQYAEQPSRMASASTAPAASGHPRGAMPASARQFYEITWGVDQLSVKLAQSDQLVRFSYRVVDTRKAAPLHDRAATPRLLDEQAHVVLDVPTMEKVGPLRQSTPPVDGKSYWMVFSNKGNYVKTGHRVSVVIGDFRVDGLVVQ